MRIDAKTWLFFYFPKVMIFICIGSAWALCWASLSWCATLPYVMIAVHECWTLVCTLLTRHWQNSIDTLKSTTYIKYNVMYIRWCIRAHTFRSGEWENWNGRSGYRHRRHLLLTIIDISSHINNISRLTIVFPIVRRTNKAHKKTRFPDDNAIVGWKYARFWR